MLWYLWYGSRTKIWDAELVSEIPFALRQPLWRVFYSGSFSRASSEKVEQSKGDSSDSWCWPPEAVCDASFLLVFSTWRGETKNRTARVWVMLGQSFGWHSGIALLWFDSNWQQQPGNVTASINFCEGPDFHHSEVLAEPVNVRSSAALFASQLSLDWSDPEVVTSVLFYLPVGLIGLLGPACKEGVVELNTHTRIKYNWGNVNWCSLFDESNERMLTKTYKNIFTTAQAEGNCVSYSLMDRLASFQTQSFRGFRLFRGWLDGLNHGLNHGLNGRMVCFHGLSWTFPSFPGNKTSWGWHWVWSASCILGCCSTSRWWTSHVVAWWLIFRAIPAKLCLR